MKHCYFYMEVDKLKELLKKTGCSSIEDAVRVAVMHYLGCEHAGGEELDRIIGATVLIRESELRRLLKEVGACSFSDAIVKILRDMGYEVSGRHKSVNKGFSGGGRFPKYLPREVVLNGSE